jgi:hypothetical protein
MREGGGCVWCNRTHVITYRLNNYHTALDISETVTQTILSTANSFFFSFRLNELPDEVLVIILKSCSLEDLFQRLNRVCKRFHHLREHHVGFWHYLEFDYPLLFSDPQSLRKVLAPSGIPHFRKICLPEALCDWPALLLDCGFCVCVIIRSLGISLFYHYSGIFLYVFVAKDRPTVLWIYDAMVLIMFCVGPLATWHLHHYVSMAFLFVSLLQIKFLSLVLGAFL